MNLPYLTKLTVGAAVLCTASIAFAQMNSMPGMQMDRPQPPAQKQAASEQAGSISRDVLHLQEAENPSQHTGEDLPAPELLSDAAQRTPIALEQFQHWAEQNNPTLTQSAALKERTEQQGRQAGLLPNPTVGYSGEHIRGGDYHGGEEGAFVQQTIVLGGKLGLRREIYRQQAASDKIGIDEQTYRVHADVQRVFYRALTAQAVIAVRRKMLDLAANAVETAHHLANVGQADAPDVLQAEVESEQAKIDYSDAQREYLQQFAMLAALCNQPSLPVSPLDGDLEKAPDLNSEATMTKLLAESPTVQRAQQDVAVAEAGLKRSKREAVPNLTVQAGEWHSGERLEGINKPAGWMGFAQAGVELPLWNRNQGGTSAARADVARAQAGVTRTRLTLRQSAESLIQGYLAARFQAERYRTQLIPRAQRAYELYGMKYQQMAAAYPQVLTSRRTLFNLQIAYLHALEMEWMNAVGLQNYTLRGGLDHPLSSENSLQRGNE
jgi:cobalt-zinc-cadmium efflux system outer membrane protein